MKNFDRNKTIKHLVIAQVIMMIICDIVFRICSDISGEYECIAKMIINITNGITCLPLLGLVVVAIIVGIQDRHEYDDWEDPED